MNLQTNSENLLVISGRHAKLWRVIVQDTSYLLGEMAEGISMYPVIMHRFILEISDSSMSP